MITATPFGAGEGDQILTPARVLAGEELRNKIGGSLGETLSQELGVSASAFGAAASRPIIRGLEGSRVKMLQNGMAVSDVSGLSNDHAVGAESSTARQIEILRGPAALLYGSGAIGGLVNVVNERIPTELAPKPSGEIEARYGTADRAKGLSVSTDGALGSLALHADGNIRRSQDYKIPGTSVLDDPAGPAGRLPNSFARTETAGFGASYVGAWGHVGAAVGILNNRYGIPTEEGSQIDLEQTRYDLDSLVRNPLAGFETFKFKLGYTDYRHSELDSAGMPLTNFSNRALESRWELAHRPLAGWRGVFGIQTENSRFAALAADGSGPSTVPRTKSTSSAAFLVEEREFGAVRMNAGARFESVKRKPEGGGHRSFDLVSYSVGGAWAFMPAHSVGLTASVAQRAPVMEELYSQGPHEATATFDIGDAGLRKETSRNIELSFGKNAGAARWKVNLFQNKVKDFVYGRMTGQTCDDEGNCSADPDGELRERVFTQAGATIRGAEAEISHNWRGEGLSLRAFADTSRGTFDGGGNLPLQPTTRIGAEAGYKQGAWRAGASLVHALKQDRLADFETTETAAYTQLDANLSYTQRFGTHQLTWFAVAKNLLNEDIRLSTSVLKDTAPLQGRSLVVGVRAKF